MGSSTSNEIVLKGPLISRSHAQLELDLDKGALHLRCRLDQRVNVESCRPSWMYIIKKPREKTRSFWPGIYILYIYIYKHVNENVYVFFDKREPRELFEDSLESISVKVLCIRSFTLRSFTLCILINTGFKTRIFNKTGKFESPPLVMMGSWAVFVSQIFLCWKHLRNASPQVFVIGGIRSILQVTLHHPKAMI